MHTSLFWTSMPGLPCRLDTCCNDRVCTIDRAEVANRLILSSFKGQMQSAADEYLASATKLTCMSCFVLQAGEASVTSARARFSAVSFTLTYPDDSDPLDIDVVFHSTTFSRSADFSTLNPFASEPGAVDAARALKVLMRR